MAGYENKVEGSDLHPSEKAALWTWHHDCEIKCADKGEYSEAQWHKERKRLFWTEPNTPP